MRKLIPILATAALFGCGAKQPETTPPPAATPTATAGHDDELAGYSEGVRNYYGGDHPEPGDDPSANIELEYHQPPKPAEAGVGETITLTGTNIGVRMEVTVTGVRTIRAGGKRYTAVDLRMKSTGITVYDGELRQAAVTYAGGEPEPVAEGAKAPCSRGFDAHVRVDVGRSTRGCLLFGAAGDAKPERLQLALETVPTDAGGIWNLR